MKRVLIITYYWPPTAGSGVQRWLKFAKYLPTFGWQPVIYTPENPDIELLDQSLVQDIPKEAEILKTSIWDPSSLVKQKSEGKVKNDGYGRMEDSSSKMEFFKWVRGNIFIPDSRVMWTRSSVKFLKQYLRLHPVDIVVTTGPPHSMHLIGARLKKQLKIKWIMDLRDPMSQLITNQELNMSSWARARYKRIEKKLLSQADRVISTSPGMPSLVSAFEHKKFLCITNGYDAEDFGNWERPSNDPFVLTHAGLLTKYRIPTALMETLEKRLESDLFFRKNFEFRVAGIVSPDFTKFLEALPLLKSKTILLGYLKHDEVLKLYSESSVLLLLSNNDSENIEGTIPGKLFEYFAARRPILSIGPDESIHASWFERDDFSLHCNYEERKQISVFFEGVFKNINSYNVHENLYPEFERKHLTSALVSLMNSLHE